MEYAFIFLALCVGLIIGFVISKLIAQNKNQEITKSFEFENQKLTQNLHGKITHKDLKYTVF